MQSNQRTLRNLYPHLKLRQELLESGHTDGQIQTSVSGKALIRLSPGGFVDHETWFKLSNSQQHLLRALCVHEKANRPPIFSHDTAALILGLPILGPVPQRVHVLCPPESGLSSTTQIARHRQMVSDDEIVQTGPLLHTDLRRTLMDIVRSRGFQRGLVTADSAMRQITGGVPGQLGAAKQELLLRLEEFRGQRGVRRAAKVIGFLDDGAESPLESLYRLQFARLGIQARTQVQVPSPNGSMYRMDLELVGFQTFFEADGRAKYLDSELRSEPSPEEALLREKEREDWVRGVTGYRVLRGGWADSLSAEKAAARLRAFGVELGENRLSSPLY